MSTAHSPVVKSSDAAGARPIRQALLSVYDKTGILELAGAVTEHGGRILASGGTAAALKDGGLSILSVEEYTGLASGYGGRVKTLHPRIHAGILARRHVPSDLEELEADGGFPIDLVCVNLYPFEEAVAAGASEAERIEKIDIGGPAMIRAAAKNWDSVAVVCDAADIPALVTEMKESGGALSRETRRRLAAKAFARTSAYDAAIAAELGSSGEAGGMPERAGMSVVKVQDLRYGENPHQAAALYAAAGTATDELPGGWRKLAGTDLSFNNWIDLVAAAELVTSFENTACVIVKHMNPCGVAVASSTRLAWETALACDPVSAFGGIAAFNRPLDGETAETLKSHFLEVIVAPEITDDARAALRKKSRLRLLEMPVAEFEKESRDWRALPGGAVLVQQGPGRPVDASKWTAHSKRKPTARELRDLEFAWKVVASVKSNAIVFARDEKVLGIGAGQMSRVDSVRIAAEKAREHGHELEGSVVASDAFFPFADGPQIALDEGATAIVQPGGSKRDADTIEAVDTANAAMMFTGQRVFRH
ncbi:bifunctional phosphoribosylaminoimidazolecarboxamide formyltransferase/IMP cyclohydrolase [bacterium]|nr:bifunctional phosphoribosylaminoimidazolecarboxamide formyltransferase/IMP cyclohydrolase [bacterium]